MRIEDCLCYRDSEIVVPSIIKFLFCLTKEKDRKLITIPKIINITDTLLANDVKSGSRALNELAFKFFFDESVCDDFSMKEINTQKEVALRMLIKFLHVKEVRFCAELSESKWIFSFNSFVRFRTVYASS